MTIYRNNFIGHSYVIGGKISLFCNYGGALGFVAEISTPQTSLKFQTKTA